MFTYTKRPRRQGSHTITIDVDRDGHPFGQIWTFTQRKGEYHPWHARPLNGEHRTFARSAIGLESAKYYLERSGGYQY